MAMARYWSVSYTHLDCADYLTKKGMPFRDAYKLTGCMVSDCIAKDKTLEELTLDEFKGYSSLFEKDIYEAIDLVKCCEGRTSYGGPSEASVKNQDVYKRQDLDLTADIAAEGAAFNGASAGHIAAEGAALNGAAAGNRHIRIGGDVGNGSARFRRANGDLIAVQGSVVEVLAVGDRNGGFALVILLGSPAVALHLVRTFERNVAVAVRGRNCGQLHGHLDLQRFGDVVAQVADTGHTGFGTVSYTHLDVYKRQPWQYGNFTVLPKAPSPRGLARRKP